MICLVFIGTPLFRDNTLSRPQNSAPRNNHHTRLGFALANILPSYLRLCHLQIFHPPGLLITSNSSSNPQTIHSGAVVAISCKNTSHFSQIHPRLVISNNLQHWIRNPTISITSACHRQIPIHPLGFINFDIDNNCDEYTILEKCT